MKIFVYGTLKQGYSAHHLLKEAIFLGKVATHPRYHLVSVNWFPGMIVGDEDGGVCGELYEIDPATLPRLDRYEGVPHLFARSMVELADGSEAIAYLFAADASGYEQVPDGVWRQE